MSGLSGRHVEKGAGARGQRKQPAVAERKKTPRVMVRLDETIVDCLEQLFTLSKGTLAVGECGRASTAPVAQDTLWIETSLSLRNLFELEYGAGINLLGYDERWVRWT